jgi:hypothetical protein
VSASVARIRSGIVAFAASQPAPITPSVPDAVDGLTPSPIAIENPMIVATDITRYVMIAIRG